GEDVVFRFRRRCDWTMPTDVLSLHAMETLSLDDAPDCNAARWRSSMPPGEDVVFRFRRRCDWTMPTDVLSLHAMETLSLDD
ncbi:hypothetical protein C7E25_23890, partial [Stenotrophomonas maltophilia]